MVFSFLDHLNLIEDDSSRYEVGISDNGFSYLDLVSEKQARHLTFAEKQERETSAALDGSTRSRGQSNVKQVEAIDHDEVCFDTDLMAILRDIEHRRQRVSVFPWVLLATFVIVGFWLFFVLNLEHPLLGSCLTAVVLVPGIPFALVNVWFFDRSRKDVHFSYQISGQGVTAFAQLNKALQAISESGQTLLFTGRRHFEDTRYSGGAESLPEFKKVQCSRGKPPLLDLEFDVWQLRAFNKDLYFMPDHVLVYDGAKMGGVNYGNLDVSTDTEVTQAREVAVPTHDAKVVGQTHRFVNNDGRPDQRFNENAEIPLIEYGVLRLAGAGLDISLFLSNQESALAVPSELAEIQELASKPVRKVAEERQAAAAARRKERQEEVFCVVLDALNCIMFADGHSSDVERRKIQQLMQRMRAPWDEREVESRMRSFRNRAATEGLATIVDDVCVRVSAIRNRRQKEVICRCLEFVMAADGETHAEEMRIGKRIAKAIEDA
jgi:hypothetical protein